MWQLTVAITRIHLTRVGHTDRAQSVLTAKVAVVAAIHADRDSIDCSAAKTYWWSAALNEYVKIQAENKVIMIYKTSTFLLNIDLL